CACPPGRFLGSRSGGRWLPALGIVRGTAPPPHFARAACMLCTVRRRPACDPATARSLAGSSPWPERSGRTVGRLVPEDSSFRWSVSAGGRLVGGYGPPRQSGPDP